MGRPKLANRPTQAEYSARSLAARGIRRVDLTAETVAALDAIMATTSEPDRPTVIRRLVETEAQRIASA